MKRNVLDKYILQIETNVREGLGDTDKKKRTKKDRLLMIHRHLTIQEIFS